jgi:hypothetical protein
MFHAFVRICMQHWRVDGYLRLELIYEDKVYLFGSHVNVLGENVKLMHPRTWFKPPGAKTVTPEVFVNCSSCRFDIDNFINLCYLSRLLYGCVGRMCYPNVVIPDMHISLYFIFPNFEFVQLSGKSRLSKHFLKSEICIPGIATLRRYSHPTQP